jgi:hypothetical protein
VSDEDPGIVYDDEGNIIEGDDGYKSVTEWGHLSEAPPQDKIGPFACAEVRNPPKYTYSKTNKFIIDKVNPESSWVEPNQTAEWTTEASHEFNVNVTVGAEAEAGAVFLKASAKLDIQVGYTYASKSGRRLSDTNNTKKGYRVRVGNKGYAIKETKTWVISPCKTMKKVTWYGVAPQLGDLSLGRFNR